MSDTDVVIVGGDDSTVLTIEREVNIVTIEKIVEIQSSTGTADTIVVAPDDTAVVTETEVVNIVELDEDPVVIAEIGVGPQGIKGDKGDKGDTGDQGVQGDDLTKNAGASVIVYRAVRLVNNLVYHASSLDDAEADVIGVSMGSASVAQNVIVRTSGEITDAAFNWSEGPIYLGQNGTLVQTLSAGSAVSLSVGVATSPTSFVVQIGTPIFT